MSRALPALLMVILLLAALMAWLSSGRPPSAEAVPAFSLDNRSGAGCALATEYLRARGAEVSALRRPLRAGVVAVNAVVLRLGRVVDRERLADAGARDRERELAWIEAGGRLVLAEPGPPSASAVRASLPLWPVATLASPTPRVLPTTSPGAAVLCAGDQAVVSIERVGAGEVVRIAVPECLANAHLATADHLALLEGLAAFGSGRPIYFDEHALGQGAGPSLPTLLDSFGLLPLAGLGALALATWWWRRVVTVGPPDQTAPERREEATDLVESLGALHQALLPENELLAAWEDRLRRLIAQRSRLHGDELEAEVIKLAGPADDTRPFRARLARLNDAYRRMHHGHG